MKIIKKIYKILLSIFIIKDLFNFIRKSDGRLKFKIKDLNPKIKDKTKETNFDLHYIYHPAWAARILFKTKPEKHIDISSTIHFSSLISSFIKTEFYDYRPADITLDNLKSEKADLNNLPFGDNSINSISCMHTVEHIGLGRHGDKIDPSGDIKAIKELKRVLAKNGNLLFVVPVGKPKLCFNAHRIYSYEQIKKYFEDLKLEEFSLISEKYKKIIKNADPKLAYQESYGCGCFWFKKI